MIRQGTVEASTHEEVDASFFSQQLDGRLVSTDSLRTTARFRLACILSVDKGLSDMGTFDFAASHIFSVTGRHALAVAELLRLIKRLEELHTKVQGMITYPHLVTTLLYDLFLRWSLYLKRCVIESSSEDVGAAGATAPFLLEPTLLKLEGGRYVGRLLPLPLADLVSGRRGGRGGNGNGGGIGGINGSDGNRKGRNGEGRSGGGSGGYGGNSGGAVWGGARSGGGVTGSTARVRARYDAHLPDLYLRGR